MRMFELIPCSNKRKEKKDLTCSSSITLADRYFFALFEPFYTWKCVRRNGNGYRKNREKLEWEERYKDERLANDRNRRIDPTSCGNIERSGFLPCWLFSVFKHEVFSSSLVFKLNLYILSFITFSIDSNFLQW